MMDEKMKIDYPEFTFDASAIIREAAHRVERKKRQERLLFLALLLVMGLGMVASLLFYLRAYVVFQIALMVIISPVILLVNFTAARTRKGHGHGY